MAQGVEERTVGGRLAVLSTALSDLLADDAPLLSGAEQLQQLLAGLRLEAQLHTWLARLAGRMDRAEVAWREHGTSTATWLAGTANLTRGEAGRLIAAGQGLNRFPLVADAAATGDVLPGQAEAIVGVLDDLPEEFPAAVVAEAQHLMVGFAVTHNSVELRRLTGRLVEVLDPVGCEEREAARVERDHRLAERNRHLVFRHDQPGTVTFHGSLPSCDAEPFVQIIEAYLAAAKRGIDRLDPDAEYLPPAMRRADALIAMVADHTRRELAPIHGGDRPRVVVTLSYDRLLALAAGDAVLNGRLLGSDEPVPPSVLRQWLCDADLLPAVLGGPSDILDVGRTQRLVTPAIRAALEIRDRGCVFPGCDRAPAACHAHHIVPWWAGGPTAVTNLCLLCPHHHGIVEPGHDPTSDRWRAALGEDQVVHVIPPRRVDPRQRPRTHARFLGPRRQ